MTFVRFRVEFPSYVGTGATSKSRFTRFLNAYWAKCFSSRTQPPKYQTLSWPQAQYEKQRNDYNDNPEHRFYDTALTHTAALPAIYLLPRILGGQH